MAKVELGYFTQPRGQGDPATQPHPSHTLMLRDTQAAEKLGFDAVWVPDHFYMERPTKIETFPDCWTLLTAIGVTTERVKVGTMVIAAGFRHPALLAKSAAALQELTAGRLILGLGAGNQAHEHNAFGLGFERRIGRFKEYLAVMANLWQGEMVTREGRHYTLRGASLRTAVPEVPVMIAAGGEQMFELTARYAQSWNVAGGTGFDVEAFKARKRAMFEACRKVGRDPSTLGISHLSFLGVAADAAEAREILEATAAELKADPAVVERQRGIGTPDQIAAKMRAMVELGVDHFVCVTNLTPHPERYWERIELLAREVLPRVRQG
jgi:alkanesulfonate monooxygenase SsuD/methylene tetrahydromethanopterin reductase-like flavin-dependent oxidoreductase (luciferase family)